MRQAKQRLAGQ
ncbi:hypothetical protein E2C01_059815 [Portunus trituberculatus]|uniref:Uncharacterized protein n=1 Tax=Portunus trituberculatus TaxID=210409 RepID=A0A5B7H8V0_PORTR|nr:hypothetical protein [Portunus trituberculatus]